ncbi:DMT family transporter [Alloalcanivorax marinus]|uniref:DMT family transporter n=1 Tax=Alloalcanivorax marinus TaxID=1177169 RepID=UPI001933A06C|nr:EamA family transporter [Alloalcanivorax marinus]MBL7249178.1 EamA family transporter [Alloalcanivorax marinus]
MSYPPRAPNYPPRAPTTPPPAPPGPPATALGSRPPRPWLGIALMAAGVMTLPLMDGLAKSLSEQYHVVQVTWARYLFHFLLLGALLLWRLRPRDLIPRHLGMQTLRSACLLLTTLGYFGALAYLPMANALALVFIGPLASTALAPLILGERAGPRRWIAVAIGFAGTLVVIRPGVGAFHWASLLALGAGLSYAFYQLTTRRLAGSGRPSVTLLYTAVFGLAVLSLIVPATWRAPDPAGWALMVLMGAIGAFAHFLIIRAFEYAAAPILAPVSYMEMVSAVLIGWLIFGDFPDPSTWLGIGLITGSGLLILVWDR